MSGHLLDPANKRQNLRLFRRYLGLSQKEFINRFLTNEEGNGMSIATFSNLESKGGSRLNEVILTAADAMGMDSMLFSMDPEQFANQIAMLVPESTDLDRLQRNGGRKGNIDQLLYRLTMYFSEQFFAKELKKGDKIESDRVLAKKMNVGRSAIREALKVLDVLGMIDIHPGQGTYISSNESNFFIIPLSWSLFLNGNQVDSIIAVRNLLEVKAAELAAVCTKKESLDKLAAVSHRIHEAYKKQDYKEFLNEDIEFHTCIAECSDNQVIYSMSETISNLMKHISGTGMVDERQLKEVYEEHQKIYSFILAHDGNQASEAMKMHLEKSVTRYKYR